MRIWSPSRSTRREDWSPSTPASVLCCKTPQPRRRIWYSYNRTHFGMCSHIHFIMIGTTSSTSFPLTLSLTLADTGLLHSYRGIAGLLNQPPEDCSKSVRFTPRILHRIATEPARKKYGRKLSSSVLGARGERPQLVASTVVRPSIDDLSILDVLARWRRSL